MRAFAIGLSAAVLVALGGCAAYGTAPGETAATLALSNPGFEGADQASCAPGWFCSMHADPNAKRRDPASFRFTLDGSGAAEGRRSLCIEPARPEAWGMVAQATGDARVRGRRVRLSLAVRTENVSGRGAGPVLVARGVSGRELARREELVTGTHGWQRLSVEMDVPRESDLLQLGGILQGTGRVCIDDARLEIVP